MNPRIDMTFARALRAILRQDPDVVMIGEIRDLETAQIAVQASLTGHLVLATLHTNDAPGAVTRLIDMGIEPYLLASTLNGVLAQRLVRKLCAECKSPYEPDATGALGLRQAPSPSASTAPSGCGACNFSGYRGRTGIYELLVADDELRHRIHDGARRERAARVRGAPRHDAPSRRRPSLGARGRDLARRSVARHSHLRQEPQMDTDGHR